MDLSQHSDEELEKIAAGGKTQPVSAGSLDHLSDDDLMRIAQGEGSPQAPIESDLYQSNIDRTKSSFGDSAGIAKMLLSKGFVNVDRTPDGSWIAKDAQGKWHRDMDHFFSHPINYAESHLGKALPIIGMSAGGAVGAAAGAPVAGVGALPGAMAGGMAGAGFGEALRQGAGHLMGSFEGGADYPEVANEALLGGVTELGGRALSPYLKTGMETAGKLLKPIVSHTSSLLTGIPHEAIERLIERPTAVLNADQLGNSLAIARKAREEILSRNAEEKSLIQNARRAFSEKYGSEMVDTSPIIQKHQQALQNMAPTAEGYGPLSESEFKGLSQMGKDNMITRYPEKAPYLGDDIAYGNPETQTFSIEPPQVDQIRMGNFFKKKYPDFNELADDFRKKMDIVTTTNQFRNLEAANKIGFNPYADTPTMQMSTVERTPVFGDVPEYPERSAKNLQKFSDYLGNEIDRFEGNALPGSNDTRYQSYLRSLRHQVKEPLHNLSPELTAADKRFSQYADRAKLLGPLDKDTQMEGFINNFYGKNKSLQREAASDLIPNSSEDIADLSASRAFAKQGPAGSEMGLRNIARVGGAGTLLHQFGPMAAVGELAATSPTVHKQVIGRLSQGVDLAKQYGGSQLTDLIKQNPELLNTISNPKLKQLLGGMMEPNSSETNQPKRGVAQESYVPEEEAQKSFIKNN